MKHLSYYCHTFLEPRELQELNHVSALYRKISAGKQTVDLLLQDHFLFRDNYRINRIGKAIRDWQEELNQIFERSTDE